MLGEREVSYRGRDYRSDCSGFVEACFAEAGSTVLPSRPRGRSGTQIIFNALADQSRIRRQQPRSGDLIFFHNTWDRNRNGRLDDRFTHVAIVERVRADGTVVFLHRASREVKRGHMNLGRPAEHADPRSGAVLNDWLRRRTAADRRRTPYTTAQCFHAFGRPQIPLRSPRRQREALVALDHLLHGPDALDGTLSVSGDLPAEVLQ